MLLSKRVESTRLMHRISGLEGRLAMKGPEMQKQMDQMRKQMGEMKHDSSMNTQAK